MGTTLRTSATAFVTAVAAFVSFIMKNSPGLSGRTIACQSRGREPSISRYLIALFQLYFYGRYWRGKSSASFFLLPVSVADFGAKMRFLLPYITLPSFLRIVDVFLS